MYRVCKVLWPYVKAHYGIVGQLWYYPDGNTFLTGSEEGVHQGDLLGSILFALAIHDTFLEVATCTSLVMRITLSSLVMSML